MYPQGAAGKFLSSLLMSSDDIAHFDPVIEQDKTNAKCLNYIKNHFTPDLRHWIKNEPNHNDAWNLHFISSKYPRGNNLSKERFSFLCSQYATNHFKKSTGKNKIILFPWHKITVPCFFYNASIVTITVDKNSEDWFDNAYWKKHFAVEDNKVKCLVHDPTLNPKMKRYFDMYNNKMYSSESIQKFYKKNITNNPDKKIFNKNSIDMKKLQLAHNCMIIELADILDVDRLVCIIQELSKRFGFTPVDCDFIKQAHRLWISCH